MDRARLRSLFPESWAGASAPEDHPGRESPTPRQTAGLGKRQDRSTHLPPASPHSDCPPGPGHHFSSSPHLGRTEGEWGEGPWAWGARKNETAPRNGEGAFELCVCTLMDVLSFASTTALQGRSLKKRPRLSGGGLIKITLPGSLMLKFFLLPREEGGRKKERGGQRMRAWRTPWDEGSGG